MTLDTLLQDYSAYNLWANTAIVNWLRTKPAGLMTQPVPSSFPTLHDTLLHIWGAEKCGSNACVRYPPNRSCPKLFRAPRRMYSTACLPVPLTSPSANLLTF
ncbi:MAG: hypothetical protein IPM98_11980 [Lewinellaceae bacterium]|nr:hypothetical protein [Lewinellaceae bacterium]